MMKQILRKACLVLLGGILMSTSAWAQNTTTVGAEDNTTGWWGAHSGLNTIAANQALHMEFLNYSSKVNNYNNWVLVLTNGTYLGDDGYTEYVVLRSDNFGWGSKFESGTRVHYRTTPIPGFDDLTDDNAKVELYWQTFREEMDGATVSVDIYRKGTKLIVRSLATATNGAQWVEEFVAENFVEETQLVGAFFTVDNCHLVINNDATSIKTLIGQADNTSAFWGDRSADFVIEPNKTVTLEFDNYSDKLANFHNWLVVVTNDVNAGADGYQEYIVLRADNYGWQGALNTNPNASSTDWFYLLASNYTWDYDGQATGQKFRDEMNGSHVVMTIARGGNVTDIYADITASSGNKYFEHFVLPCGNDGNANLRAFLTLENAYLLLDESKTTVTDTKITGTITASGYNSFSSYFPLNLTGIKAYKITGVDNANKVVMSEVTGSVPAQTGLLLEGTAGADFTLLPTSAATTAPAGNLLVALPNGGQVAKAESGTNYVFGWEDASKPGFFRVNDVLPTLGAGKAYLHVPAAEAPFLSIDLGGETTGVKSLTPTLSQEEGAYYTLDGRRVSQPTKGLYIVNGKKVMVK